MNALEKLEMLFRLVVYKVRVAIQRRARIDVRYRVDSVVSERLKGNSLGCPSTRELRVYLPPGYDESVARRYPVIYILHGYNAGHGKWTITSRHELAQGGASMLFVLPRKFLKMADTSRLVLFYEQIDALIRDGQISPVIIVQVDGSLRLPVAGKEALKGSFYVASPRTGDFPRYILEEIIPHVDARYRTIQSKDGRALVGGSMGGYGVLHLASINPDLFSFVASSCPMEFDRSIAGRKVPSPLEIELLGQERAEAASKRSMEELVATIDMVVGPDWESHTMRNIIDKRPDAFKRTSLYLYCEVQDEFGLAASTRAMHDAMERQGIKHEFVVSSDPQNSISPHVLASLSQIRPLLKVCTARLTKSSA